MTEVVLLRKTVMIICVLACISLLTGVMHNGMVSPEITAAPGQVDPYKTRAELLMDAASYIGVCMPEQAAAIWVKGLEQRSAALQYVVMTDALKKKYAQQLDALRSNWVTGMSSPWVNGYTITEIKKPDDTHAEIGLIIETMASHGRPEYYRARLRLVREGDFWRIEQIQADEGLYWYTLYQP